MHTQTCNNERKRTPCLAFQDLQYKHGMSNSYMYTKHILEHGTVNMFRNNKHQCTYNDTQGHKA